MCGILVLISKNGLKEGEFREFLISKVAQRGPDQQSTANANTDHFSMQFTSSVLFIRGNEMSNQPLVLSDGSIFMFNGEIFNISSETGHILDPSKSDTQILLDIIEENRNSFPQLLSSFQGPYAIVFYDKPAGKVWFGRDIVGRRSLCRHISADGNHLILSSVCPSPNEWEEVNTEGIYCLNLLDGDLSHVSCVRWSHSVAGRQNTTSTITIPSCIPNVKNVSTTIQEASDKLSSLLSDSVYRRVTLRRKQVKVAILFSGGIDSTIIALIAHRHLPEYEEVDLINVAFTPDAPDRLTAIKSYEKLSSLCSNRSFRLILVSPSKEELTQLRSNEIKFLIYPLQTVLDDSVGCALWFASRASGKLYPCNSEVKSTAPILLHGLGADELMAGYTRHRRVYDSSGKNLQALQDELNMDLERIHCRNLGRDDRIVSDHGKEARFPFLDEQVIGLVNCLPVHLKCNLDEPRGYGEKKLLRHVAMSLGLEDIAHTEKRAMQFGCRIAKLEQVKESASTHCSRLDL